MTLQQVKEQVAYDSDYPDWNALVNEMAGDIEVMEFYLDIIARQYAGYVAVNTLKDAVKNVEEKGGDLYDICGDWASNNEWITSTPIQLP